MSTMNRRSFLLLTAASVTTSPAEIPLMLPDSTDIVQANTPPRPWYSAMRRCGQINFNERDPLTMDTVAWADY